MRFNKRINIFFDDSDLQPVLLRFPLFFTFLDRNLKMHKTDINYKIFFSIFSSLNSTSVTQTTNDEHKVAYQIADLRRQFLRHKRGAIDVAEGENIISDGVDLKVMS